MIDPFDMMREAGAGSYPDAPDISYSLEDDERFCEECDSESDDLIEFDGKRLCQTCRGKLYAKQIPDAMWLYITESIETAKDFFLKFWLESLSDAEKIDVLKGAFVGKFRKFVALTDRMFYPEGEDIIYDFVRQDFLEFAQYVEKERLY